MSERDLLNRRAYGHVFPLRLVLAEAALAIVCWRGALSGSK